jgi:hypothetical protein
MIPVIKARVDGPVSIAGTSHGKNKQMRISTLCFVVFDGSERVASEVRKIRDVQYVEQNQYMKIAEDPPSWGLNRIDQPHLPLSSGIPFTQDYSGFGQTIYILDTGVNAAHREFGGRVVKGPNFSNDIDNADLNGHGTHCAGTAAGLTVGIAKQASIVDVKVLNSAGSGSFDQIIEGIAYATSRQKNKTAIISMSVGGGKFTPVNDAVKAASNLGMIVVVAAGNNGQNACNYSPAGAGGLAKTRNSVITVGATDSNDARASYSNYGSCVDMFAPGTDIFSSWKGSTNTYATISGTSMATPHVAGVAATLLEKLEGNKTAVITELFSTAIPNIISNSLTPNGNYLLQSSSGVSRPPTLPTPSPTQFPTLPPTLCVGNHCFDYFKAQFGIDFDTYGVSGFADVPSEDIYACTSLTNNYTNKVLIIKRGTCTFQNKAAQAQYAGAAGVILYMSTPDPIIQPTPDGTNIQITIPVVMISLEDGLVATNNIGSLVTFGNITNTRRPTRIPTRRPSKYPTRIPTRRPSKYPTRIPTRRPTLPRFKQ